MTCVLLLAAGHAWEATALTGLDGRRDVTVLKRCVDVDDLLAAATTGQADVAVLALDAPGLDPASVAHLRRYGVRPIAVTTARPDDLDVREQAQRLQVSAVLAASDLSDLARAVTSVEDVPDTREHHEVVPPLPEVRDGAEHHRTIVVWGPGGAPGRTTVAVNLAAEVAGRGAPVVLADLDPWGGSVAQQLGVLDEASGVLGGARLAGSGQLEERFGSVLRGVGEHLSVLTGLPRADRWREVRSAHVEQILDAGIRRGHVVVDTGFALEEDGAADLAGRPTRNAMTTTALDLADEVVVVGAADPVGLARLARGLVDLRERGGAAPVRVVVNRMRATIGWSEKEIAGMVEGFTRAAGLHFLPDDRAAVDRALVSGSPLVDSSEGALSRAIAGLTDAVLPATVRESRGRLRGPVGRRRLRSA